MKRILVCLMLTVASAHAAAPTFDAIYPAGARRNTKATVTILGGKLDPAPAHIWCSSPDVKFTPTTKPATFTVDVASRAQPGPHLVRVYNADGPSIIRAFYVSEAPDLLEAEPNDDPAKPQPVAQLPTVINGQLDKTGDVDSYQLTLKEGDYLVASLQGWRLGSLIDPMLHLHGPDGRQLAFAHDGHGLDPLLAHKIEKAGTYTVRVSAFANPPQANVNLAGGKNTVYRLHVTQGSFVRSLWPSGVVRGQKSRLQPLGWNVSSDPIEIDATNLSPHVDHLFIAAGEGQIRVPVSAAESTESPGLRITAPINITGRLVKPGEEDRYPLIATKEQGFSFSLRGQWPMDAVLRVDDASGKTLADDDDGFGGVATDARFEWTAREPGAYHLVVSDRFNKGGDDHVYRLEVRRPAPGIVATPDADSYKLPAGGEVAVKVTIDRDNHSRKLVALATDLPPGVTSTTADVPEKKGTLTITLKRTPDSPAFSGPFRIILASPDPANPEAWPVSLDLRPKGETGAGQRFLDNTPHLWLTLPAPPPPATQPTTKPAKK